MELAMIITAAALALTCFELQAAHDHRKKQARVENDDTVTRPTTPGRRR
jgi:hypothetical protein